MLRSDSLKNHANKSSGLVELPADKLLYCQHLR